MAARDEPHNLASYRTCQSRLDNHRRAPTGNEGFQILRAPNSSFVFRDFTPFLLNLVAEGEYSLIRGRRWGKTSFGDAWLAYLRCDHALFAGTAVEGSMPASPKIGVCWDFTLSGGRVSRLPRDLENAIQEGIAAAKGLGQLLPDWNFQLERSDPLEEVIQIFQEMQSYAIRSQFKFALFVDEYDFFVNSEKDPNERKQLSGFFYRLFSALKGYSKAGKAIPNQFITGTSRLALKEFFSGPNAIKDISFDASMAEALGYTWEQIEALFPTQLLWLEHVKQLTRDQLKSKLTEWYDRHRWSPDSQVHVFNPYSIHQFMTTGVFTSHWAESGSNSAFLRSKPLMQNLLRSLMDTHGAPPRISIMFSKLKDTKMPADEPVSDDTQIALLVGAGILAIHPEDISSSQAEDNEDPDIFLVVPNKDAEIACREMLSTALLLPPSITSKAIEKLLLNMDIFGLFNLIVSSGALKILITNLIDEGEDPTEKIVSAAFAFLMQLHRPVRVSYRYERRVTSKTPTVKKSRARGGAKQTFKTTVLGEADHVLHLDVNKITLVFEFKMKSSRNKAWEFQLEEALHQILTYLPVKKDDFTWLGVVVIFDDPPNAVEILTKPLTESEITTAYNAVQTARRAAPNSCASYKTAIISDILSPLLINPLSSSSASSSTSTRDD